MMDDDYDDDNGNGDDGNGDGDKPWLAEQNKKESWFYARVIQEGWKVMHYEGHWHIHSSFLIGKSDSESSMPGLNHGRHVLSDYCIDGRVSGAFSSFYALCIERGFLYLSRNTVSFLTNLFSIIFSKSLQALVRSFSGFSILLRLVCRILAEKKKIWSGVPKEYVLN